MALVGNGSDAYGATANTTFIDSETFTVEFWVKAMGDPSGTGIGSGMVTKWQNTNWNDSAWQMCDELANRRLYFEQSTPGNRGASASNAGSIVNNFWKFHSVVHRSDATTLHYVDGVLQSTTSVLTIADKDYPIEILRSYDALDGGGQEITYFNGKIMELRMFTDERTQAEIQQNMRKSISVTADNLKYYWPLTEQSGTTAVDRVSGLNFSLSGSFSWDTDRFPRGAKILQMV